MCFKICVSLGFDLAANVSYSSTLTSPGHEVINGTCCRLWSIFFLPTMLWTYWLVLHTACSRVSNDSEVQGSFRNGAEWTDQAKLATVLWLTTSGGGSETKLQQKQFDDLIIIQPCNPSHSSNNDTSFSNVRIWLFQIFSVLCHIKMNIFSILISSFVLHFRQSKMFAEKTWESVWRFIGQTPTD